MSNSKCRECVSIFTKEGCEGCLDIDPKDAGAYKLGQYPYRNFKAGDGYRARLEVERRGDRNIVIGGQGEHEINALWSINEAYEKLAHVSEECGGLTTKDSLILLTVCKETGEHRIEYMHDKLYRITRIENVPEWAAFDP